MKITEWEDLVYSPTGRADGTVSDLSTWKVTREHAYLGVSSLGLCKY